MGWQPGEGSGTGGQPAPGPGAPAGASRDDRLSGFARGAQWDQCPPGPELAAVLAAVAGPEWRCPGAEPDELIGVVRRLAALESWASAAKLAVVRELIRQDDMPALARPRHGDLPDQWSDSLNHELALALAVSVQSAERTALTAWELGARLPGIAALHADGTLAYSKAKLIVETFQWLSDADAARAEAMIIPQLTGTTGKTWGQVMNLAARIASEVDPGLAERRRKAAVKHGSRVQMFRERSGAAGLSGRDLPAGETLTAYANLDARAAQYKDSGAFPGALMDQLRTTAYLDLINGRPAESRIAQGNLSTDTADPDEIPDDLIAARPGGGSPGDTEAGDGESPRADEPGRQRGRATAGRAAAARRRGQAAAGRAGSPQGVPSWRTWSSRSPRCSASPTGRAKRTDSASSTRTCAATSPGSPPPARTARYASRSPTPTASPSATAADGPESRPARLRPTLQPEPRHLHWPCPPG